MPDDPNLAPIINLMNKCFLDENSLKSFVISFFLSKFNQLKDIDSIADKILTLVVDIYRDRDIPKLLEKIKEKYPQVYQECRERNIKYFKIYEPESIIINHQEFQAIKYLKECIQDLSFNQLQSIYLSCRPNTAPQIVNNINEMLTELNRILPSQPYRPLIQFVVIIQKNFSKLNQSLENWLSQYGNLFGYAEVPRLSTSTLNPTAPNSNKSSTSSLLIEIKKLNPNYIQVQAWFWSSQICRTIQEKEIIEVNNEQSELEHRYHKVAEKFTELIEKANRIMKKIGSKSLRIELFVTTQLLQDNDCYIDWLKVEKLGFFQEMCKQYNVVFRLAERLENQYQDLKEIWENKWRQVTSNNSIILDYSQNIECQLNQAQIIGIKLDTVSHYRDFFKLICLKALPIALWSRCDLKTSSCLDEINRILTNVKNNFRQLPQEIQNERNSAPAGTEHIGHHICLLWDDPERMPPDPQKPDNALMAI